MDNKKENFGKITSIKKKIVCCFLCCFFCCFNSFSAFADVKIPVQDGPYTVEVRTNLPFSVVVPAQSTSSSGQSFSEFDIPMFTQLLLTTNQASDIGNLCHLYFYVNLNINGPFLFSTYPSGAQFQHNIITKSYLSDNCCVSVTARSSSSIVKSLQYDIWFLPQNVGSTERHLIDCGFSDVGTLTFSSTASNISLVSSSPSFTAQGFSSYTLPVLGDNNSILTAMLAQLEDLNYQAGISSDKLQQLISLTSSVNNMLSIINSQFSVQTNSINNKLDMESQEIQDSLKALENAVVKSLTTINNTLILINNGIGKLDSDMVTWFNRFFSTFIGWDISSNPPVGSVNPGYLINSMKETWGEIIEKGLDKVAPDTDQFDDYRDNASGNLGLIENNELIKDITNGSNVSNASVAFEGANLFFSSFGTKILYFNNKLMEVYNSLGDFRYVIVITMVIGLITFIFKVGNTFIRSHSGSGGKDINLPRKLR